MIEEWKSKAAFRILLIDLEMDEGMTASDCISIEMIMGSDAYAAPNLMDLIDLTPVPTKWHVKLKKQGEEEEKERWNSSSAGNDKNLDF